MTVAEREDPKIIDASRRSRIANGSGMKPQDVTALVSQFSEMQKMMKQFGMAPPKSKRKGGNKKKNKRRRGGGRTTAKGSAPMANPTALMEESMEEVQSLRLPGLPPQE